MTPSSRFHLTTPIGTRAFALASLLIAGAFAQAQSVAPPAATGAAEATAPAASTQAEPSPDGGPRSVVTVQVPAQFLSPRAVNTRGNRLSACAEWEQAMGSVGALPDVELAGIPALDQVLISGSPSDTARAEVLLQTALKDFAAVEAIARERNDAEMAAEEVKEALDGERRAKNLQRAARLGTLDMQWEGGTLAKFAQQASEEWKRFNVTPLNVLFQDPKLSDTVIPPFVIQAVAPITLFQTAAMLATPSNGTPPIEVVEALSAASANASPVHLLRAPYKPAGKAASSPSVPNVSVYNMTAVGIEPARVDAMMQAVSVAFELQGRADKVVARFHEPTGLLFISCPNDANAQVALEAVMHELFR